MGSSGVLNGAVTILSASIPLEKRARTLLPGLCSGHELFETSLIVLKRSLLRYCGIMYVSLNSSIALILILEGGQIGVVSSPLIGGVLTEYATWRWCAYRSNS